MDVKAFYKDINGNYNEALSRMMIDSLIVKMVTKFMNDNSIDTLISYYDKKDYRALFASAHTLKGVAGNLSLTPLFDIACEITEMTRNSDDVNLDKQISLLKNTYALIQEAFNKYLVP